MQLSKCRSRSLFFFTGFLCILSAGVLADASKSNGETARSLTVEDLAYKAIAIRLDAGDGGVEAGKAFVLFDTNRNRYAMAWTGSLAFGKGVASDAKENTEGGLVHFVNPDVPGWATPAQEGKYQGLADKGTDVVLSYKIGDVLVRERPGIEQNKKVALFLRTIDMGARTESIVLELGEGAKGDALLFLTETYGITESMSADGVFVKRGNLTTACLSAPKGSTWDVSDKKQVRLNVAPGDATTFTVVIARVKGYNLEPFVRTLNKLSLVPIEN